MKPSCAVSQRLILRGEKLCKRFGGLLAVSEFDFAVEKGQIVGLIGPNGAGKSTLFNLVTGFYRADSGRLIFKDRDITNRRPHEITREGIARTFQIPRPFMGFSAIDNVMAAVLYGRGNASKVDSARERALEALEFVGLVPKRDVLARSLVLMDRRRLELARALALEPQLLLLDEVFAGLNQTEIGDAIQLIYKIREALGITIVMVEHVMKMVMATSDKIIVMNYGVKIAEGKPEEVARNSAVIDAYLGQEPC